MSPNDAESKVALVVHILPEDMARGAQSYARALVDRLDSPTERHRLVTLFRSPAQVVMADHELDVPMRPLRSAGLDPRVVLRLRRLLGELRPQVVVAHGGEAAKYAAVAKQGPLPMIYLMIGASHPKLARALSRRLYRFVLKRCFRIVAVSTQLADEAREMHGVPSDRVLVIPNGRDAESYRPAESVPSTPVRLGWVGHMDEAKRPDRFLEALRALARMGVGAQGWMAGDGPLLETIRGAADVDVEVLGPRDDVPDLLRSSHLLVFTGRPPEGMPGVLIEAGLSGVAVVTTRVPGAEDVVEHEVTGLIVEVDAFDDLVESLVMLIRDPERRRMMGEKARQRCIELYSLDHTVQQWRSVVAEAREAA